MPPTRKKKTRVDVYKIDETANVQQCQNFKKTVNSLRKNITISVDYFVRWPLNQTLRWLE